MEITIKCTAAEQVKIKQNLKTDQNDTVVIYKPIYPVPEGVTCGEYLLGGVNWEIEKG